MRAPVITNPTSRVGPTDVNGIEYVQPILSDGYRLNYSADSYTYTKNFRSDGSMRMDFKGLPVRPSVMIAGYIKCRTASPNAEEISPKLNGGPHNDTNPTWADTMDLGAINMLGTKSRVRWEKTHPNYSSEILPTYSQLPIGDIRNVWRGCIGMKLNIDTNWDGTPDQVCLIGMVDVGGLDASYVPVNDWRITFKRYFLPSEIDLKSIWEPYVVSIGQSSEIYQTLRVDEQLQSTWLSTDPAIQPYRHVTLKTVTITKARDVCS